MRRLLIAIALIVLLAISLATGLLAADWPFWQRALRWEQESWPSVLPGARLDIPGMGRAAHSFERGDADPGGHEAPLLATIDALPMADALLVLRGNRLLREQYRAGIDSTTLLASRELASVLPSLLYGIALGEGSIDGLDSPVARLLPEWGADPRGNMTARQLLWNLSGLEAPPFVPWNPLHRRARLASGPDFARAALAFQAGFPAGSHFEPSPANPQLLGLLLERAIGGPLQHYLQERLWKAVGAGPARAMLDRSAGRIALHCCFDAAARDWLRLGALLANNGEIEHMGIRRRILPGGWVEEMSTASPVHPGFGLGLEVVRTSDGAPLLHLAGTGRSIWVLPRQHLVVLRFADAGTARDEAPLRAALQAL
jgi:hypothetical protein